MSEKYRKFDSTREAEVVEDYLSGQSIREITKHHNVGRTTIGRVLSLNNVTRLGTGNARGRRKYAVTEDYFEEIDSEEKAYWLGFICADGHVSDEGVRIYLNPADHTHIRKFLTAIGSSARIFTTDQSVGTSIWSERLVRQLRSHGLHQQKSLSLQMPAINAPFVRAMLRGMFDGDGSIRISTRLKKRYKNPTTEYSIVMCGTRNIVERFRDYVCSQNEVSVSPILTHGSIFVVEWAGRKQTLKILDWLYSDACVFLDRKYERWLNIPRVVTGC